MTATYIWLECPLCQFSAILSATERGPHHCPVCYEYPGDEVEFTSRPATDDDDPRGRDARQDRTQ